MTTKKLSRQEWIAACHFHDLKEKEVLKRVADRISKTERPLVLFDLDSTLYEVGPRTHQILKEWRASVGASVYPRVIRAIDSLEKRDMGYSLKDTFHAAGLNPEERETQMAIAQIKTFWSERFFSSRYLEYDHAYPGAAPFVRRVYEMGAEVVYLTGRDEPGMGKGTRSNLVRDGFPWQVERTHLLLKPRFEDPDLEHKVKAADYIRRHGTLIASFENEPANISALYEVFPDAMHVFVDTVYSDHESVPRQGLYRIKSFEAEVSG